MAAVKNATISLKLPLETKNLFEADCSSIGLTPSALLHSFIHYVTTRGRIPEDMVEPDPFYSEANRKWLRKGDEDLKAGRYKDFTMEEVDAMFEKALGEKL